jgi:glucokinase
MKEYVIGIDLGGTDVKAGVVDIRGRIKTKRTVPTDLSRGADSIFESIKTAASGFISADGGKKFKIIGIGVGTPGAVDKKTGRIAGGAENLPGWKGAPLIGELSRSFGLPVFASNDVTLHALGEAKFGAAKGRSDVFCFSIGTGIGGGFVAGGRLYRGAGDAAAEVGHMTVKFDGRKCNCGSRGCFESYASAEAIARAGKAACRKSKKSLILESAGGRLENISAKDVFRAAKKKDPDAVKIVEKLGFYLGVGIANIINLFNPEVIIIGGGVSRTGKILIDSARKTVGSYSLETNIKDVEIVLSSLHFTAGVLGAAALCWQELRSL